MKVRHTMKNINIDNLMNLCNLCEVTDQPIIVHDIDADADYDIRELIRAAQSELTNIIRAMQ